MTTHWKRKGLFYHTSISVYRTNGYIFTSSKKLDLISYHLIKLIHGQEKLDNMAMDSILKELGF